MPKKIHDITEYALRALPENPKIFAVERKTFHREKFAKADPNGKELGEVYDSVIHIVSPYYNYYTGENSESCSCLSWRTRRKRCIHLKKFFAMNPQEDPLLKSKL